MARAVCFRLDGEPQALARPRIGRTKDGRPMNFDPESNKIGKSEVIRAWRELSAVRLEGPLDLDLECRFARAKGHYGTGRNAGVLKASAPMWVTKRPDVDNLVKLVCDALNGWAYHDDAQVVSASVLKAYAGEGDGPHTLVTLTELE